MSDAPEFRVDVRAATQLDIDALGASANTGDGASAVFVNGALLAVCDEYGTATLAAGDPARQEAVETLNAIACDLIAEADDGERFPRWASPATVKDAQRALRAYGQDLRTSWSDFDGRSGKAALNALADAFGDPAQMKALADEWAEDLAETERSCGLTPSGVGRP